MSNTNLKSL